MTAAQQGEGEEDAFSWWMRAVQGFEVSFKLYAVLPYVIHVLTCQVACLFAHVTCAQYEATYASFVGAFSMVGMLPVLPGPCGLFNMKHLNGSGVDFFFEKVKQGRAMA